MSSDQRVKIDPSLKPFEAKTKEEKVATMKYYILNDDIADSTIQPLLDFINQNEGSAMQIGISSGGGFSDYARFISDVLNQNKEYITLVAVGNVYSAAFRLFHEFEGTKKMTFGSRGMAHHSYQTVPLINNGMGATDEAHAAICNSRNYIRPDEIAFAESFMFNEELEKFKQGKEVYFDFARMRQIFPNAEIV